MGGKSSIKIKNSPPATPSTVASTSLDIKPLVETSKAKGSSSSASSSATSSPANTTTVKKGKRMHMFRNGKIFNCALCGDYGRIGHTNDPMYHFSCCELCGKSKNHSKIRDMYYCACTNATCPCAKGSSGQCKRGICGVCLFDQSNCIMKMKAVEARKAVQKQISEEVQTDANNNNASTSASGAASSSSSTKFANSVFTRTTRAPNSQKVYPGECSFKKYMMDQYESEMRNAELIGAALLEKDCFDWKLCCQCVCWRIGGDYGEICPCSYHQRARQQMLNQQHVNALAIPGDSAEWQDGGDEGDEADDE